MTIAFFLTCHGYPKIPVQSVWNKLVILPVPEIQLNLNQLEKALISQNILIKKVNIMPKGRFPKLKGGIHYIAID